ncbi:DNA primase [Candidatus Ruminimicrobiellum ovillum]|uniref:DNA primase n=1 Tax=Candidatus Ruminimicrobiellum ovillum TaxID=1947927 RepID=UPI00355A1829
MSIPDQVIEQIRTASDIVSVIGDYVPDLKKAGRNFKCCCPFHTEKTPSFIISPEKGIFRCFGCGVAGDVFKFVMLIENISWIESVKKLAEKNGIAIKENFNEKYSVSEKTKIFELLEMTAKFYNRCLLETKAASFAREYVKQRGMTDDTIKKFMIGYAPKGKLLESARKKGYAYDILSKAGLFTKTDFGSIFEYMSERLVFPILDIQGRVVAFGGRTLADSKAKYLNTPETIVYSKSSNLYGLYQTLPELRKNKSIIVVEGYMDVVLSQQYGVSGAVAPLGTAFTSQQAKLINRYAEEVTLLFDPDDAGRTATQRALEICAENNMSVKTSSLPEGVDPDEYLLENGRDDFYNLLNKNSKNAIEFVTERILSQINIKTAQDKAKAVSMLLDFVDKNKNIIVQREYIKFIAQKLDIEEDVVWQEFKRKTVFKTGVNEENFVDKTKNKSKTSLEEKLLKFLLDINNRQYIKKLEKNFFRDGNCVTIYNMLLENENISIAQILSKINDKKQEQWFSNIAIVNDQLKDGYSLDGNEEKSVELYEIFNILCRDIGLERLEKERKILEKEVLLMTEGKIASDKDKINRYLRLTAQIKGSGKK